MRSSGLRSEGPGRKRSKSNRHPVPRAGRGAPKKIAREGWPARIVCLTEESVEFLYDLGLGDLVVGVSHYARRPREVRDKPKVSSFIKAHMDRILALKPDLVITFSDLQADIVRDLIRVGLPVFASNQRSIAEIFTTLKQIGALVGYGEEAEAKCLVYAAHLERVRERSSTMKRHPRVYFEEWPDPLITGIGWVSELIEIAGGRDVFSDLKSRRSAAERIVSPKTVLQRDPEFVFASWCGKPFKRDKFLARPRFSEMSAARTGAIHAIPSELILQPGPAALTEGVSLLQNIILQSMA